MEEETQMIHEEMSLSPWLLGQIIRNIREHQTTRNMGLLILLILKT